MGPDMKRVLGALVLAVGAVTPKVQFVAKEGHECLQPVVTSPPAALADYRAAEQEWLAKAHPGLAAPRWETVLLVPPDSRSAHTSQTVTVQRETAHLDGPGGSAITVCFDINLSEVDRKRSDP